MALGAVSMHRMCPGLGKGGSMEEGYEGRMQHEGMKRLRMLWRGWGEPCPSRRTGAGGCCDQRSPSNGAGSPPALQSVLSSLHVA